MTTNASYDFTTNDMMDCLEDSDTMTDVTLFIRNEEPVRRKRYSGATSQLGVKAFQPQPVALSKYVGTNTTGRVIKILFWGAKVAEYQGRLVHQVVRITRARVADVNKNFIDSKVDVMGVEMHVQDDTTVEILGTYEENIITDKVVYRRVELVDVNDEINNSVEIVGYIKMNIVRTMIGAASYGCGLITDGTYRLRVNVAEYKDRADLEVNTHVKLEGILLANRLGKPYLQLQSMNQIVVIDEEHLSIEDLKNGFRPPPDKRAAE